MIKFYKTTGRLMILIAFCCLAQKGMAQINPLKSSYFGNQYLANPAMAGLESDLKINLHYRNQFNISGAFTTQAVTADYGFGTNAGIGLNVNQSQEGLLTTIRAMGTYAYHLPLNNSGSKLHFGLSLGVVKEQVDIEDIVGDQGDQAVMRFNDRGPYFESDFGLAYTDNRMALQVAFPNIRTFVDEQGNEHVNDMLYLAAASYKFDLNPTVGIEPKVVYRGMEGYDDLIDIGANVSFVNGRFNVLGIYHNSKNATVGVGLQIKESINLVGMYTSGSSALNSVSASRSGSFEVGLQATLLKNK